MEEANHKGPRILQSHLHEMSRLVKSLEAGSRLVIAWGWGQGGYWRLIAKEFRVSFQGNVLKIVVMVAQRCEYTKSH